MKNLLSVAALLASFALASAQSEPWCRCALFVSSSNAEWMVAELPEVPISDCSSSTAHEQCRNRCVNEFFTLTNEMDLWSTVNGETVGQSLCTSLADNFIFFIHNSIVHGYYEMCGGPWEYAGMDSQQMLCCSLGQHQHCISRA